MSIKLIRAKRERVSGEDYWRNECRKARKETEYWKCWTATLLLLLVIAVLIIIYLMIYGRG